MPTYEFRCPDGHEFEKFYRKISDAVSELPCPVCGKVATRQVSGGAGLLFKGSGFYLTDYGKNAHRKPAPSGGDSAKGSDSPASSGESKSSDAKPAETKPSEVKPAAEVKPAKKRSSGPKSDS
jgi:putative FmdB family regulatory protein